MKKRGRKDDGDTASKAAAPASTARNHSWAARCSPDGGACYRTLVREGRIGGDFWMIRYFTPMGWTIIVGAVTFIVLMICG